MLDCDNDHSEDPAAWITPQVLADSLLGVASQEVGNGQVAIEELDFRGISAEEEPGSVQSVARQVRPAAG